QAVDLVLRVVVDDAGANGAAVLESQVLHRLDRVVVAVPDGDLAFGEGAGDALRRVAADVEAEGRNPALHRPQAVELDVSGQPLEEALAERSLVAEDPLPADRVHVVHRRDEAREELVLARPELEAMADRLVRGRADLVRPPGFEEFLLAERES